MLFKRRLPIYSSTLFARLSRSCQGTLDYRSTISLDKFLSLRFFGVSSEQSFSSNRSRIFMQLCFLSLTFLIRIFSTSKKARICMRFTTASVCTSTVSLVACSRGTFRHPYSICYLHFVRTIFFLLLFGSFLVFDRCLETRALYSLEPARFVS